MTAQSTATPRLTEEEISKDDFFRRIADLSKEMTAAHGKDFATGALVLAARWTADGRMAQKHDA